MHPVLVVVCISVKILVSFIQVLYKIGPVFQIRYPSAVVRFYTAVGTVFFNWMPFLPIGCAIDTGFFTNLYIMTLCPIAALAISVAAEFAYNTREHQQNPQHTRGFHFSYPLFLFGSFACYTAVSTSVLEYYHCETLEDGRQVESCMITYRCIAVCSIGKCGIQIV